eukprot:6178965-Pleurochrysis_carterae.AAC.1
MALDREDHGQTRRNEGRLGDGAQHVLEWHARAQRAPVGHNEHAALPGPHINLHMSTALQQLPRVYPRTGDAGQLITDEVAVMRRGHPILTELVTHGCTRARSIRGRLGWRAGTVVPREQEADKLLVAEALVYVFGACVAFDIHRRAQRLILRQADAHLARRRRTACAFCTERADAGRAPDDARILGAMLERA